MGGHDDLATTGTGGGISRALQRAEKDESSSSSSSSSSSRSGRYYWDCQYVASTQTPHVKGQMQAPGADGAEMCPGAAHLALCPAGTFWSVSQSVSQSLTHSLTQSLSRSIDPFASLSLSTIRCCERGSMHLPFFCAPQVAASPPYPRSLSRSRSLSLSSLFPSDAHLVSSRLLSRPPPPPPPPQQQQQPPARLPWRCCPAREGTSAPWGPRRRCGARHWRSARRSASPRRPTRRPSPRPRQQCSRCCCCSRTSK